MSAIAFNCTKFSLSINTNYRYISAKNALLLLFADSVLSYSVVLTFSNVSLDTWRLQSKNLVMQETIANLTSDFCRANSEKCGVSSGAK